MPNGRSQTSFCANNRIHSTLFTQRWSTCPSRHFTTTIGPRKGQHIRGSVKSADATSGQTATSATGSSVVAAGTGTNPAEIKEQQTLSDYLLQIVLSLLWMEVPEHGKHLSQYFSLFVMYASLGIPEKKQLLKLNVPATFINVALDEGPGPPIKYQYSNELGKLYQVVSQLIRCCDISVSLLLSIIDGAAVLFRYFFTVTFFILNEGTLFCMKSRFKYN